MHVFIEEHFVLSVSEPDYGGECVGFRNLLEGFPIIAMVLEAEISGVDPLA